MESSDGSVLLGGAWQQRSGGVYYYLVKTQPFLPQPTPSPSPLPTAITPTGKSEMPFQTMLLIIVLVVAVISLAMVLRKKLKAANTQ